MLKAVTYVTALAAYEAATSITELFPLVDTDLEGKRANASSAKSYAGGGQI